MLDFFRVRHLYQTELLKESKLCWHQTYRTYNYTTVVYTYMLRFRYTILSIEAFSKKRMASAVPFYQYHVFELNQLASFYVRYVSVEFNSLLCIDEESSEDEDISEEEEESLRDEFSDELPEDEFNDDNSQWLTKKSSSSKTAQGPVLQGRSYYCIDM